MNNKLPKILKFCCAVLLLTATASWSQNIIFKNEIDGTNPSLSNPFTLGQQIHVNATATGIGRSSGLVAGSEAGAYSGLSWNTPAVDPTAYFDFTISPVPGYKLNFTELRFQIGFSGGPNNAPLAIRSNLSNYQTNIPFVKETFSTPVICDLSGSAYQQTSSITFRIYPFGSANASDRFTIYNFTFSGTVTSPLGTEDFNLQNTTAYPNPVADVLTIENPAAIESISVFNIFGQQLLEAKPNKDRIEMDFASFESGIYLVKIVSQNTTKLMKIVKK